MSPVPTDEVFHEGWVVREGGAVVDASSSVTVVRAGPACIVVDTGSRTDLEAVSEAFASKGVRREGVTHVVNTHLHTDHCGCNHLFADARFFAHSLEDPPLGTVRVDRDVALVPGVRLVHTPGHTQGSMSVLQGIRTQPDSFKVQLDGVIEIVSTGNFLSACKKSPGFL